MIGVFVDGWTALGGSQWINSEATGRYRDYLVEDVVAHVDANFRTVASADGRGIFGKSSGGYGALVMGRHHPDVFGHLACHSGDAYFEYCYLPDFPKAASVLLKVPDHAAWFRDMVERAHATKMRGDDHPVLNTVAMAAAYSPNLREPLRVELPFDRETGRLRDDVWQRWLEHDPVRFVPENLARFGKLKTIFIDCGAKDEFHLRWGARMVVETLRKSGLEVFHEEFEDGHMGINYRYDRSLLHVVPRMAKG
ncbi:MAG TPA: alpha/beta hydrolase-fold protein, partial [Gemmatimonadaceae bacterium]|nr:alpha/beta hydrolase-fold protein [Gemmatimonadaceae bacterium]